MAHGGTPAKDLVAGGLNIVALVDYASVAYLGVGFVDVVIGDLRDAVGRRPEEDLLVEAEVVVATPGHHIARELRILVIELLVTSVNRVGPPSPT